MSHLFEYKVASIILKLFYSFICNNMIYHVTLHDRISHTTLIPS